MATANQKLKGGLYVQSVLSNSPASRAQIQKGDILVGLNDGATNYETLQADSVLYVVRRTEQTRTPVIRFFLVRKNAIHQGDMAIRGPDGAVANASATTR